MTTKDPDCVVILEKIENLKNFMNSKFEDLKEHQGMCAGQFRDLYSLTNYNKNKLSEYKVYMWILSIIASGLILLALKIISNT